jgi:alkylation response protein AidB-like acyl-CoA dehydrogenase
MADGATIRPDERLLAQLSERADRADTDPSWPAGSLDLLRQTGAPAWDVPRAFGGQDLDRVAQLEGNEQLAAACLTTAFIFSQREAALRWMLTAPEPIQQEYLPALARGEKYVTVGLSQLTTSRQHRPPSLRAEMVGPPDRPSAYRLDGLTPWVTGADHADGIVTGAVLPDGRQVVMLVSPKLPGVRVDPPLALAALAGSRTAQVHCSGAEVPAALVLAGPEHRLVRSGGGLETSCLALGLARAGVEYLRGEGARRPEAADAAARLAAALDDARGRLHALAGVTPTAEEVLGLRVVCTRLVLRATQAALAVAKGFGFLLPHPTQRWARQALFFLVWSCPLPAASALLADLAAVEP